MAWQPMTTKRGRNITRPSRHFYGEDLPLANDMEHETMKPAKRSRRASFNLNTNTHWKSNKGNLDSGAKMLPLKPPSQVRRIMDC